MHKGPENLVKNFLADCLWNPKKHPRNLTLPPEERSPLNGPFIPQASFGAQMSRFVWPRTLSAGRLPADPETKPLGFWKAEEHMKAGNFVFEAAFHGLIDEEGFAIATLAAKLMQTVYVIGAKCGWTAGLREVFEKLSYALAVRSEEYFGPKLRQLQHEICFHPLDDLMRHGSPDALWCWLMERYIKVLGSLTKNGKQIETTMTIKVVLGLVSAFLSDRREDQKLLKAGKLPGDADWAIARECFGGGLLIMGSQKIAIRMENLLAVRKSTTGSEDAGILHSITTRGVGVGSLHQNWRPRNWKQLGVESRIGVEAILLSAGAGLSERWAYVPAKSVQVRGANFAKGDLVVVGSVGGDENEEEFGQIKLVYVVEDDQEQRRVFVELSFFGVLRHEGELVGGEGHGLRMLGKLAPLSGGCVRLATSLLRHFIYFLEKGKTLATATYGHVIEVQLYGFDFKAADVYIPVFVEKGDVVRWAVTRPEGAWDVSDFEYVAHPINGKAILKMLKPNQVLEYGFVVETDAVAMTCKVRRLERVLGTSGPATGVRQWQTRRNGRNLLSLKVLTWNRVLDYVDGAVVVGEIGQRIAFPTPPAILQSSGGPYWRTLTG